MHVGPHIIDILRILANDEWVTIEALSQQLKVSRRTIASQIDELGSILADIELEIALKRQPGKGLFLEGERQSVLKLIENLSKKITLSPSERERYVLFLLLNSQKPLTIQHLADSLHISRSTVEKHLIQIRKNLGQTNITLLSTPYGLVLQGNEAARRQLYAKIMTSLLRGIIVDKDVDISFNEAATRLLDTKLIEQVVDLVNQLLYETQLDVHDYEYQSFVIHLAIAIARIQEGLYLTDEEALKPSKPLKETALIVEKIERTFKIQVVPEEIEYINMHIETMKKGHSSERTSVAVNQGGYGESIQQLLRTDLNLINPDDLLITNLTNHLNTAIKRLKYGMSINNPYLTRIKTEFDVAYALAKNLAQSLEKRFSVTINDDEIAYIAIHIQSFIERQKVKKVSVVLVCASGIGTVKLLEQRLLDQFSRQIEIVATVGLKQIHQIPKSTQLIISTIPLEQVNSPMVYVFPLLSEQDIAEIQRQLTKLQSQKEPALTTLVDPRFVFISKSQAQTKDSVLQTIVTQLIRYDYGKIGLLESAYQREQLSSTAMGDFAMPHGMTEFINKSTLAIYVNKNGIQWGNQQVKIVFFIAFTHKDIDNLNQVYVAFNALVSDQQMLERLINAQQKEEIIEIIKQREEE